MNHERTTQMCMPDGEKGMCPNASYMPWSGLFGSSCPKKIGLNWFIPASAEQNFTTSYFVIRFYMFQFQLYVIFFHKCFQTFDLTVDTLASRFTLSKHVQANYVANLNRVNALSTTSDIGKQKGWITQGHHRAWLNKVVLLLFHKERDVGVSHFLSFRIQNHQNFTVPTDKLEWHWEEWHARVSLQIGI